MKLIEISKLPLHIQKLFYEVDSLAESPVCFEYTPQLEGLMSACIQNDIPKINYRDWSEAGLAEELMHLKLMLCGVLLTTKTNNHLIKQTAIILQNIIHHHVIFPELVRWGYKPNITECDGVSKQLIVLETNDLNRTATDSDLSALMSLVYARVLIDCGCPHIIARLDNIFSKTSMSKAKYIGINLVSIVRAQTELTAVASIKTLSSCLELLDLHGVVVSGS